MRMLPNRRMWTHKITEAALLHQYMAQHGGTQMLKLKSDFNMNLRLNVSESAQTRLSEEPQASTADGTSKQTLETPHVLWQ